ncbi:hypothetical protein [Streptomyces spiralis]|uniref:hypothetical protein n=1 Tax=Streptomyces spiralis TaxID=66376 RepID=UPI0036A85223
MGPTVPPNGWRTGRQERVPHPVLAYMVAGAITVVVVLGIFDESHCLTDEAGTQ